MRLHLGFFGLLGLLVWPQSPAFAIDRWQVERDSGDRLERIKNNQEALKHYQLALACKPGPDSLSRAYLQCQMASLLVRQRRFKEACAYLVQATPVIKSARDLKQDHEEAIYAVTALREDCISNLKNAKLPVDDRKVLLSMCENIDINCLPEQMVFDQCITLARFYLVFGDTAGCLQCLEHLKKYMIGDQADKLRYDLRLAVLQKRLHKPEMFDKMVAILHKSPDVCGNASVIADAQTWAVDYDGAIATIYQARSQATKTKTLTAARQSLLLQAEIGNYLDRGLYKEAEAAIRKWVALPIKRTDRNEIEYMQLRLNICLDNLHKKREKIDGAIIVPGKSNKFDFLADEERDAQLEIDQKHSKRQNGK